METFLYTPKLLIRHIVLTCMLVFTTLIVGASTNNLGVVLAFNVSGWEGGGDSREGRVGEGGDGREGRGRRWQGGEWGGKRQQGGESGGGGDGREGSGEGRDSRKGREETAGREGRRWEGGGEEKGVCMHTTLFSSYVIISISFDVHESTLSSHWAQQYNIIMILESCSLESQPPLRVVLQHTLDVSFTDSPLFHLWHNVLQNVSIAMATVLHLLRQALKERRGEGGGSYQAMFGVYVM